MSFTDSFKKSLEFSQEGNFQKLFPLMKGIKKYEALREVQRAYKAIQDEIGKDEFVFTNSRRKEFWARYNEIKAKVYPAYAKKVRKKLSQEVLDAEKEVLACIESTDTVENLKKLKRSIYKYELLKEPVVTTDLYDACDAKIQELQQAQVA